MDASKVIWFFSNAGPLDVVPPLLLPIGIGLLLYQFSYFAVALRALWRRAAAVGPPVLPEEDRVPVLATVPSLLRRRGELDGLQRAALSLAYNGYPGAVRVVLCVDGTDAAPALYAELMEWARDVEVPRGVAIHVVGHAPRRGKGVAIDTGVQWVEHGVEEGRLSPCPEVFFNVDADCELEPGALGRMVFQLRRRHWLTGERGRAVTSHVAVPREHFWQGPKSLTSLAGILRLSVAREYMVSLGLGRFNWRLIPQLGVSGALYCTHFEIAVEAPRYARFMDLLTTRHWLRWLAGLGPPSYREVRDRLAPMPEGVAGMGDDTWMTWLALLCRWEGDRLTFELPPTPLHALWEVLRSYWLRPYRYDPQAKIWTGTPSTLQGLYRQRMRWNTSRIWTFHRWARTFLFAWHVGVPAFFDVVLVTFFHIAVVAGLLLVPFTRVPSMWFAMFLLVEGAYFAERSLSTLFALFVDGSFRRRWPVLLALPTAGLYHFVINIASTIDGFFRQVLGHGLNSGFSPERTLIRGNSSRLAVGYRLRRALHLAVRSVLYGDVPFGWWWFGWRETPWTPNGYEGWDSKEVRLPSMHPPFEEERALAYAPERRPPGS